MEKIEQYDILFRIMAESGKECHREVFANAERWAFKQMVQMSPDSAQRWLDKLESIRWDNYLSKDEAKEILSGLINQDGSKGPHWSMDKIQSFLESNGLKSECEGKWNKCALVVTMNMIYSDNYNTLFKYVEEENIPMMIYDLSVEKLEDIDRPHFIRDYFGL